MDEIEPTDVAAALAARAELGATYDRALAESFAERVEQVISQRAQVEVARRGHATDAMQAAGPRQMALATISVLVCVPISIVLGVNHQFAALLITLAAIVAVNAAHAWQSRPRS